MKRIYYELLDGQARQVYDAIRTCIKNRENSLNLSQELVEALNKNNEIFSLVFFENYDLFIFDLFKFFARQQTNGNILSSLNECYLDNEKIEEITNIVRKNIIEIKKATIDMNEYEKVVFVHDYLASNVQYDLSEINQNKEINNTDNFNIIGPFINHKSVCQGICQAANAIFDNLGIESSIIYAMHNGNLHSLNIVYLKELTLLLDITNDMKNDNVKFKRNGREIYPIFHSGIGVNYDDYTSEIDLKIFKNETNNQLTKRLFEFNNVIFNDEFIKQLNNIQNDYFYRSNLLFEGAFDACNYIRSLCNYHDFLEFKILKFKNEDKTLKDFASTLSRHEIMCYYNKPIYKNIFRFYGGDLYGKKR